MRFLFILSLLFINWNLHSQEKIIITADDGLLITADLYEIDAKKPYILLFHQAGFSRGEYKETTQKIIKFGYNCLAVDLRSGGEVNYIQNNTALLAVQKGFPTDYLSSEKDIGVPPKYFPGTAIPEMKITKEKTEKFTRCSRDPRRY